MVKSGILSLLSIGVGLLAACTAPPSYVLRVFEPAETEESQHAPPEFDASDLLLSARVDELCEAHPSLYALVVLQRGRLVKESYHRSVTSRTAINAKSTTKAIQSALVGAAIDEGLLPPLDSPVLPLLVSDVTRFPEKKAISLENLLSMRSGIEWSDDLENRVWDSANWVETILGYPMAAQPGQTYTYATFNSHLVSAAFTRTSGRTLMAYANESVFDGTPIRITNWKVDPQGANFGGSNAVLTARDLAAFGELIRVGGSYSGRQVIPQSWVERMTAPIVQLDGNVGPFTISHVGYSWYRGQLVSYPVISSLGFGGQFLVIAPGFDAVVVVMSDYRVLGEQLVLNQRDSFEIVGAVLQELAASGAAKDASLL